MFETTRGRSQLRQFRMDLGKYHAGVLALVFVAGAQAQKPTYHLANKFPIPGDGGWDYISIDSNARRLYVSHGTELQVLDADSGSIVGTIPDTPGVHGIALAREFNRGFVSNGGTAQ